MVEKKSWELTEADKRKIQETAENSRREGELLMAYNEYVSFQKNEFLAVMKFVTEKINSLIGQGKISDFIQVIARIKAAESSILNDETKALDDIFGMEIITATEEEINIIIRNLSPYMIKTKCKNHDKENGYKAKHKYWTLRKDKIDYLNSERPIIYEHIPMVEFQLKTSKVYAICNTGSASHTTYKGETKAEIQKKFDNGGFSRYTNVPTMWASRQQENGLLSMELLSLTETLKKIYPFLNTMKQRGI